MRNYMKCLGKYLVTVTAGLEHTASTFTDSFVARNEDHARQQAEDKWAGAAIGAVAAEVPALTWKRPNQCGCASAFCMCGKAAL